MIFQSNYYYAVKIPGVHPQKQNPAGRLDISEIASSLAMTSKIMIKLNFPDLNKICLT